MNKYLLTALIAGVLGGTVAGFNAEGVKETDLDKRGDEIVGRVLSAKRDAAVLNAQEKDSVTLTVKWIQKKETSEKDSDPQFFIIVDEKGGCVAIARTDLVKNKNNTYSMKLPKGVYQTVLEINTDTPEASGIGKYLFKEDVRIDSDTTLTYDGNEATHRISFDYIVPSGEKMKLWSKISSKVNDYAGANVLKMSSVRMLGHKNSKGVSHGTTYIADYNYPGVTGSDRTKSNDVFLNDVKSSNWFICTNFKAYVLDTVTKDRSKKDPLLVGSKRVSLNVKDTVYKMKESDYLIYNLPKFQKSLSKSTPMDNVTGDFRFHGLGSGLSSNGSAIISLTREENPRICGSVDPQYPMMISYSTNETSRLLFFSASTVSGIATPKMLLEKDGGIRFLMSDNIYEGMQNIITVEDDEMANYVDLSHPEFEYSTKDQTPVLGTTAPVFSMPIMEAVPSSNVKYNYVHYYSNAQWLGNFGERRTIDNLEMSYIMKAGNDTIVKNWNELRTKLPAYAKTDHDPQKITTIVDNRNFQVDSLAGHTHVEMSYDEAGEDRTTPTVQMMQMRDRNGNITNKFGKQDEGEIRLAYGDFYFDRDKEVYKVLPCDLKLEVSPYGMDKFIGLKATEEPEMFRMPVWGYFSRAKIGKLERTGNGWWDLRITLKDKAGNTQVQTVSPAFYAGYSDPAGVGSAVADSEATVVGIYDITGVRHSEYVNGINIVKYSDGTTKKIMVRK